MMNALQAFGRNKVEKLPAKYRMVVDHMLDSCEPYREIVDFLTQVGYVMPQMEVSSYNTRRSLQKSDMIKGGSVRVDTLANSRNR